MKTILLLALVATIISVVVSQRPFYAGLKPIGYPELAARFEDNEVPTTTQSSLGNRFGEDGQPITTTTIRLPVDALGDRELVDRISKWPRDKWPFWYANWRAIEEHRSRPAGNPINTNTRSSFAGTPVQQQLPSGGNVRSSFARDPNIDTQQRQQYPENRWSSGNLNVQQNL